MGILDSKSINKQSYQSPNQRKNKASLDESIDDVVPEINLMNQNNKALSPDKKAAFKIKPTSINFSSSPNKINQRSDNLSIGNSSSMSKYHQASMTLSNSTGLSSPTAILVKFSDQTTDHLDMKEQQQNNEKRLLELTEQRQKVKDYLA